MEGAARNYFWEKSEPLVLFHHFAVIKISVQAQIPFMHYISKPTLASNNCLSQTCLKFQTLCSSIKLKGGGAVLAIAPGVCWSQCLVFQGGLDVALGLGW